MYLCYNTMKCEFVAYTWGSVFGTPGLCESCQGSSVENIILKEMLAFIIICKSLN
jgi:hypothetical protein